MSTTATKPVRVQRESDLSEPAQAWLRSRGFTPYAEVPLLNRNVDLVGRDGVRLCCVEMKMHLNRRVMEQAYVLQLVTPDAWCFVGRRPRDVSRVEKRGLGLAWFDGDRVVELLQPNANLEPHENYIQQAIDRTTGIPEGGTAGIPCLLGVGPAQDCYDRVEAYRQQHPTATWREVFKNVSNHYQHERSLQGAMRIVRDSRAMRARREAV